VPRDTVRSHSLRVIIAGGGTGGHVYPALAVAEELRRADPLADILFLGTARGLEARVIPARGYAFTLVQARGFPRAVSFSALASLLDIARGFVQTLGIVRRSRPDVVLGTGGYVSAPLVLASALLARPIVVQEQNAIPGVANRLLGRLAREVHVAFPGAARYFDAARVQLSGNPLRHDVTRGDRRRAAARFGFDADRTTVLVFGGSLGARSINGAVASAARLLATPPRADAQFLVQTGEAMEEEVARACRDAGLHAYVAAYLEDMGDAYAIADLAVCRAGAMTLAELAACGLPAILVPYPYAAHGHQSANAAWFAEQGAAEVIADGELTGERFDAAVRALLAQPEKRRAMAERVRTLARPDAASEIVRSLYRAAGRDAPGVLAVETSADVAAAARAAGAHEDML
jgi:UDP-N-acetylglucosamine--N-acetylmuramyl-(pentapeptide) pyrophosphoryl-undecaprenol N-acetylglucosamine transferase